MKPGAEARVGSGLGRRGGFTLLEVVVAMAIVGLGVVTLLEIFSLGLRLSARSAERTEAVLRGRELMDSFLARGELVNGTEQGSIGGGYPWRIDVKPHEEEGELRLASRWELKEVKLEMRYTPYALGARQRQLEMSTLRLVKKKGS